MNDVLERIHSLLEARGDNPSNMCKVIGLSQSTFAMWKKNDRKPASDWLAPIAEYLGVSIDYILTGKENTPHVLYEMDKDVLEKYVLENEPVSIKVLGRVAAGVPIEAVEDIIGEETISKKMAETGEYFGLRISGDSMEPRMFSGDVVIVRQQNDVESGQTAIVMVNGDEATCKKIEKHDNGIMLVPLNKKYQERFYTNEDIEKLPVRILGRVVEVRGRL